MKQVIDVRDMHTAIHSLYLVKSKPKTTLNAFLDLESGADEIDAMEHWSIINANTENLGEVHWQYFKGQKVWKNRLLVSDVFFDDGENRYKVIGSFDIWG